MKRQVCTLALFGLLAAGCSKQSTPSPTAEAASVKPEPVSVKVAQVETRQIARSLSVTGTLNPDETVTVSSEVPGRVVSLKADFGQTVHKGTIIAELDKQELNIALERSRAALAQALARVGLEANDVDSHPDSSPAVRQALAQLDDAKFKYESAAKLVKSGDISQERFTELEKSYWARKAATEMTQDDLRTQLANVRALRSDVRLAEKRLNDASVRSPFDGAISLKQVSVGQYIKENTPIYTLVKTYPLRLRFDVPEGATGSLKVGALLSFTSDAAPGREFKAVVREMDPSLDPKSRTLTAEARLTDQDPRLRPGIFVQVQLVTDRSVPIVVAPKEAVYSVAGLSKVFVVRNGRLKAVTVPPSEERQGFYELPAGEAQAGDRVAISNLGQLVDGIEVKVLNR